MTYEELLKLSDAENLIVKEKNIPGYGGRVYKNRIAINRSLRTQAEKSCVLAEELGHHYTNYGDIMDQDIVQNRKQELRARLRGYDMQIGLIGIVECYKHHCRSVYEMAEYLQVTEEYLKEKLYEIRGKRVLLDADLAEIYGYDTKGFNRQVKNNIEKFDEDFMFELTDDEVENLRSNFLTANLNSKSRYNPHVFTEQGLYMLMTVLKGPLAVKQSKALIRTFKKMKDYILENRDLIGKREILQLSMETANNRIEINKINSDMISLEKQISDVAEGLKDVVTKSELADMMNSFVSDDDDKWLMFNAKFSSADEVYESIYKQAKSSIYVVDNYIGLRTLVHLKNSPAGVAIILFSDNVGNNKLHNIEFIDFCKEYPTVNLSMKKTGGIFHDRFIVLDYGTSDERVFLCGASSKDAGARITSIVEDYGVSKYAPVIATLLKNPTLILPQ